MPWINVLLFDVLSIMIVATHSLLQALITQGTKGNGLKVILKDEVGDDSTNVCYQQGYDEGQHNTGQGRQSCAK